MNTQDKFNSVIHCQTVLEPEELEALRRKTGYAKTREALYEAVVHYLECDNTPDRVKA